MMGNKIRQSPNAGASQSESAHKPLGDATTAQLYVVQQGDTLPSIAEVCLGDTERWREIYEVNRDRLETPDSLKPGQRLALPKL